MASPRGLLLVTALALCASTSKQDLVLSTETPSSPLTSPAPDADAAATTPAAERGRPDVYSLHVTSRVEHRYARTVVSSRLANRASVAQEASFSLVLPETAFISAFLIETEGKVYEAYVKEKEEAKKEYAAAIASGQTAAHVAVNARDANTFTVSVNVAPGQKTTFNLTYEELLQRRLGAYTHSVHVAPGQVVRDLRVEVLVEETRNLSALRAPAFRAADAQLEDAENEAAGDDAQTPGITVERLGGGRARVLFAPTPDQQRKIAADMAAQQPDGSAAAGDGLSGRLVVQYDVERDPSGGEVLLQQGYFVHFFAPADLPPLPKHVIFVLDVSGSMEGRKVQQLKEAMATILSDLKPNDYFNLLEFSYSVTVWNLDSASNNVVYSPYAQHYGVERQPGPVEPPPAAAYPATPEYVQKAKDIVGRMTAGGGTNIHDALRTALAVARTGLANASLPADAPRPAPIVVFLTDGEPTVGESRSHKIFQMVSERNEQPRAALFSLAFGDDADLPFLKRLSLRNSGFARKIYEAADAALQLRNFYRQVASPLLSNVTFQYTPEAVTSTALTKKVFPTFFAGSELVVTGRLAENASSAATATSTAAPQAAFSGAVVAQGASGEQRYEVPFPIEILLPTPYRPPQPPGLPEPEQPKMDDSPLVAGSKKNAPSLERLWAYLTIRQMLDEREANSGLEDSYADQLPKTNLTQAQQEARDKADAAKARALELALEYSFVTPLTSLVVVKPNGSSAADLEGARRPGGVGGGGFLSPQYPVDRISAPLFAMESAVLDETHEADYVDSGFVAEAPQEVAEEATTIATTLQPDQDATSASATERDTPAALGGGGFAAAMPAAFGGFGAGGLPGRPGVPAPLGPTAVRPQWLSTHAPSYLFSTTATAEAATDAAASEAPSTASPSQSPSPSPSPSPAPALGTLSDLTWLTNALNGTTGSLLVPTANGTRLLRLGLTEENKPFEECSLPEGAGSGPGAAHCRHLPHCVLPDISRDMQSYVRYFCTIGEFAGVCCPDAAFPAAS